MTNLSEIGHQYYFGLSNGLGVIAAILILLSFLELFFSLSNDYFHLFEKTKVYGKGFGVNIAVSVLTLIIACILVYLNNLDKVFLPYMILWWITLGIFIFIIIFRVLFILHLNKHKYDFSDLDKISVEDISKRYKLDKLNGFEINQKQLKNKWYRELESKYNQLNLLLEKYKMCTKNELFIEIFTNLILFEEVYTSSLVFKRQKQALYLFLKLLEKLKILKKTAQK